MIIEKCRGVGPRFNSAPRFHRLDSLKTCENVALGFLRCLLFPFISFFPSFTNYIPSFIPPPPSFSISSTVHKFSKFPNLTVHFSLFSDLKFSMDLCLTLALLLHLPSFFSSWTLDSSFSACSGEFLRGFDLIFTRYCLLAFILLSFSIFGCCLVGARSLFTCFDFFRFFTTCSAWVVYELWFSTFAYGTVQSVLLVAMKYKIRESMSK